MYEGSKKEKKVYSPCVQLLHISRRDFHTRSQNLIPDLPRVFEYATDEAPYIKHGDGMEGKRIRRCHRCIARKPETMIQVVELRVAQIVRREITAPPLILLDVILERSNEQLGAREERRRVRERGPREEVQRRVV